MPLHPFIVHSRQKLVCMFTTTIIGNYQTEGSLFKEFNKPNFYLPYRGIEKMIFTNKGGYKNEFYTY